MSAKNLADALKEAGYFTAIVGKWHLGNWYDRHLPRQRGFDHQYGLYGALISYYGKARERFYDWHRNGIDEPTFRAAIGNAAKASKWFKNLNDGSDDSDSNKPLHDPQLLPKKPPYQ